MSVLVHDVEVDGRAGLDVRLADGRITAIGPRLAPAPGDDVLDGHGGALLPGLHDHHLHLRATGARGDNDAAGGLWRISLEAVDGWTLRASAEVDAEDRGPFARLLGAP